jgi:hypothetical protein
VASELDGLSGTGCADPNHERHAPTDDPSYLLDEALAFLASEVRSLASAPQRRDAVYPGLYKALHDRFGGIKVDLSPFVEGRDHRGHQPSEHRIFTPIRSRRRAQSTFHFQLSCIIQELVPPSATSIGLDFQVLLGAEGGGEPTASWLAAVVRPRERRRRRIYRLRVGPRKLAQRQV